MELAGLALELGKLICSPIRDCCKYHRGLNEYMEALKEKLEELQCHKHDIELRLRTECLPGKKAQREVQLWQEKVKRLLLELQELNVEVGRIKCFSKAFQGKAVLQKIKEVEDLLQRSGNLSNKFSLVVDADDGKMLPAATLTGDSTAKRKMAEVWECLLSNDVQKIGLYGIGGSGKTTIMKHVYNQLLERTDKFANVIWVTMSTAFDVIPIQQDIAEELRLDLSNFEEETKRAQELYAAFRGKRRCLLILDDLWEAFPLNRIGIPEPTLANGCKIVLTTRSLEVCRRMDCKAIRMELLTKDEAWELFLNEVGQDVLLRMDLKALAEQVAKECACLPLAIVAIASSLKGSVDMSDWLNALEELKKSRTHTDMGTQVIEKLKLSYSRLKDKKLQHCLLHCALYPKDEEISRDALINELMDEGIIDDSDSRQAQVNKGHAMLNKLENACLLESCESYYGSRCVKMHDLVREMALQIMNATPKAMVEAGLGLKRIPDQEKWFEDLVKVSLINNDIKMIPSNLSPRCPQLSTLWLRGNPCLECIPDSFFKQLHGLKVLDLSRTGIERLPDSISDLVCLTALLLGDCYKLKHIPSLVKLRELKKLVVNETSLEEAPHGMDQLSTLRYLDIFSRKLEMPAGMLPRLSNLELLRMGVGQVQEAAYLSKLQSFECCFHGLTQFNEYLESQEESHELSLTEYCFVIVGQDNFVITSLDSPWRHPSLKRSRKAWIRDCNISMTNFKKTKQKKKMR